MTHGEKLFWLQRGHYTTFGVCSALAWGVLLVVALNWAWQAFGPIDDSDFDKWHRSGLEVHTDALSGRQYLVTPGGGITPRLDADGRQVIRPKVGR